MSHDGFTEVEFKREYPQKSVALNDVLMSFLRVHQARAFREWWEEEGAVHFQDWLNRDCNRGGA